VSGPGPLQQRIGRMDAMISMRLHGAILATTVGVPSLMLSYDPKVTAFANALGVSSPLSMDGLTAARVFDGFQALVKDREKKVETVRRRRDEFAKQAQLNLQVLRDVLG
jgi:polysaccharide pyruvyl transferase WcaK-like protein